MQKLKTLALLLAALMAGACSGGNNNQVADTQPLGGVPQRMSAVAGSSLDGISFTFSPKELFVNFESIVGDGQHVEFSMPSGVTPVGQNWAGNGETLSLVLHADGVVQVGVAPLVGYGGNPVTVTIQLGRKPNRLLSGAPTGGINELVDLTLESQGDGNTKLEWSEVNRGDYDFNSQVNVADITPIAIHFSQSALQDDPGTTNFWVDGDGNGEVNVSDITPIAINFLNDIHSYRVVAPIGDPVIALQEDSFDRPDLPNKYSVILPGNPYEGWQVAPISKDGEEGLVNDTVVTEPDLLLDINIAGLDLYNLDGSGNSGPSGNGQLMSYLVDLEPMRRLMPGEIPNMVEIGQGFNPTAPSLKLYEVPNDRYLALLVLYIPTIDLVTGEPRELGGLPGLDIWEYDPVVSVVPFNLEGLGPNSNAVIEIHFEEGPFEGYYSNIATEGLGLHMGSVKLDNGDGVLWRDSNTNLDFEDEARMWDEPRWGITNSRLNQLAQLDEYANGENTSFLLGAIVDVFNQENGEIGLKDTLIDFDGPEPPFVIGELVLSFSEYATFASKPFETDDESPINPSDIEFGTEVEIRGYKLVDDLGGLETVYWGEHIVKIIR